MLANNAGFNCVATRVLVTAARLAPAPRVPRRARAGARFAAAGAGRTTRGRLRSTLPSSSATQTPPAGKRRRGHAAVDARPRGRLRRPRRPVLHDRGVLQSDGRDGAARRRRPSSSTVLVRFCNDTLWGTLCASLIVKQRRDAEVTAAVNRAVLGLRYGSVCVNAWPALPYALERVQLGRVSRPSRQRHPVRAGHCCQHVHASRAWRSASVRHHFAIGRGRRGSRAMRKSEQTQRALAYLSANPSPVTLTRTVAQAIRPQRHIVP